MRITPSRRVSSAGSCPTICYWIVLTAGIQEVIRTIVKVVAAPDDHLAAGPDGSVIFSAMGRISDTGWGPAIGDWIVSPAGIWIHVKLTTAPDDHFTASPDGSVLISTGGRIREAGCSPTIRGNTIPRAGVQRVDAVSRATPDDHLGAVPDRSVKISCGRRVGHASRCPLICARIVSAAIV